MIIDFSCYHTTFKAAYLHLSKGIKENDNLKKFNFFGKFNGGLIALLGNGKARGIQETKQGSHSKGSTKGGKSSTNSKKEKKYRWYLWEKNQIQLLILDLDQNHLLKR